MTGRGRRACHLLYGVQACQNFEAQGPGSRVQDCRVKPEWFNVAQG